MMQHEYEERIGRSVDAHEWDDVHMIYQYSPKIPDVGGKDIIAALSKVPNGLYNLYKEARALADADGWKPIVYTTSHWWGWNECCDGYVIKAIPRTIKEIQQYVNTGLDDAKRKQHKDGVGHEVFSDQGQHDGITLWPITAHWTAVYYVTGGSEGHYVHVDAIDGNQRTMYLLLKTFEGEDHAAWIVGVVSKLLYV